ncbi:hypothetical protein [Nonomuraea sp. NPDC052265]
MDSFPYVVCRGPKERRLAVEEQVGVALLHPVDQLARDIVDGPQVGHQS